MRKEIGAALLASFALTSSGQKDTDWNGEISSGPLDLGFDYNFIIPATGDRVP